MSAYPTTAPGEQQTKRRRRFTLGWMLSFVAHGASVFLVLFLARAFASFPGSTNPSKELVILVYAIVVFTGWLWSGLAVVDRIRSLVSRILVGHVLAVGFAAGLVAVACVQLGLFGGTLSWHALLVLIIWGLQVVSILLLIRLVRGGDRGSPNIRTPIDPRSAG